MTLQTDRRLSDDIAYMLPMGAFLLLTYAGTQFEQLYSITYIVKTIVTAGLLIWLRPHFTKISWRFWWLGLLLGVIGIVQWVGMEKLLLHEWPNYPKLSGTSFSPDKIDSQGFRWVFLAFRLAGPVLVVPFMEELFWRDFLWRSLMDTDDFKRAEIGKFNLRAVVVVTALFASVHIQWITALVWGLMIAVLLIKTKSIGACIIMHATTNLLLGIYVMMYHDWYFW